MRSSAWQVLISTNEASLADLGGGHLLGNRQEQGNHSAFAQALLQALHGDADQDPGDGVITASELVKVQRPRAGRDKGHGYGLSAIMQGLTISF
ncbi:MAG TPA: hypothetical protein PKE45_13040 [Caldilineaceae bacterium]|nr:hypothetical protein [Caldilineaceae bacterium]